MAHSNGQPNKRKAPASWEEECSALIASTSESESVAFIVRKLDKLQRDAQARFIEARNEERETCGVRMIESIQKMYHEEGDYRYERKITAKFTAGPDAAPFSLSFSRGKRVGDECVTISIQLPIGTYSREPKYEKGEFRSGEFRSERGGWHDTFIPAFLEEAGLPDTGPQRADLEDEAISDTQKRRWVYYDVIYDAIELVMDKYGNEDGRSGKHGSRHHSRRLGELLGISAEIDIYDWLQYDE